jgi:phospholipase/carboxylesterase|tara:strand:- start:68 stop:730 length:663 start_codon:yes stop_codon:yes gene_type:complete
MKKKEFISSNIKLTTPLELSLDKEKPDKAFIVLHGWGANQHDLVPFVRNLNLKNYYSFFPNAPFDVPGTAGTGKGWFSFPINDESENELAQSKVQLLAHINEVEKRGFSLTNIVIMGFSQGAAMALEILLSKRKRIGAVISLSGFLIDGSNFHTLNDAIKQTPIFLAHGQHDTILPLKRAKLSAKALKNAGLKITWREYPMAHEIIADEVEDIRGFLNKI